MFSRRQFFRFIGGLGALSVSTTAYGFGEPVLRLRVARYDLLPPQWPAGFDLKIAVVADVHACDPWMSLEHIEAIVDRTNALNADVIVMLGDYVAGHRHVTRYIPAREWAPVLAGLKAPLGVHAILGNHDWWEDKAVQREGQGMTVARRALEAAGIPVYENDATRLTKAGRPFWLAGLGDQLAWLPARRFRPVKRIGGRAAAFRAYPWRPAAVVRVVAGGAVALRKPAGLRPHPDQLRRRHFRRSWVQHHAVPPRRPAGNRAGDAGRISSGHFMTRECLRAALPGLSGFGGHRARQIHQMLLPPPKQVRRADARREIMSEIAPTPAMPRTHKDRRE